MRSQYYGGLADASCGMGCEYRWENFGPTDETVYDGSDYPEVIMAECHVHSMKWSKAERKHIPVVMTKEEVCEHIGADSLEYLTIDNLKDSLVSIIEFFLCVFIFFITIIVF